MCHLGNKSGPVYERVLRKISDSAIQVHTTRAITAPEWPALKVTAGTSIVKVLPTIVFVTFSQLNQIPVAKN